MKHLTFLPRSVISTTSCHLTTYTVYGWHTVYMASYLVISCHSLKTQTILWFKCYIRHLQIVAPWGHVTFHINAKKQDESVISRDHLFPSSDPARMFQNWRQNMCLYNFLSLSITLSRSCCLLSIKVRAWKVFFFWSGFPGVTPERCSVAVCLWYAKPIYRLGRRAVASHHNSQPQDTSSLCPCAPALCSQTLH